MTQENVDLLIASNAALNRGDVEGSLAGFHPDVEWRDLMHAPDVPERIHGEAAVRGLMEVWVDAFDAFRADVTEYIEAGNYIVCVTHWRGTGRGSGIAVDVHSADVYEFEDGSIIRVVGGHPDKDTALKSIGLAE
jgi:ketosteroid isomerase-like protein